MRVSANVVVLLALLAFPVATRAQDKKIEPGRVVGTVLGQPITAGDVGYSEPLDPSAQINPHDPDRWGQLGAISQAFGPPIIGKFLAEHRAVIEPTAEEYAFFLKEQRDREKLEAERTEKRLAELKQELATPGLPPKKIQDLERQQRILDEANKAGQSPIGRMIEDRKTRSIDRMMVIGWKGERELYKSYGGRVTSDTTFPKSLDARKRLYEEAEKKGDLKFNDPGVRHLFYYDFIHTKEKFLPEDAKPFEKPPWGP